MPAVEMITWLYVSDLDRSRDLYARGFDLTLLLDQGDCLLLGTADGAYLGLCLRPPPTDTPGLLLCFIVDNVEKRTARLVELGATLEKDPQHNAKYGIVHSFLRDHDGHRIEIQRFDDPQWKEPLV